MVRALYRDSYHPDVIDTLDELIEQQRFLPILQCAFKCYSNTLYVSLYVSYHVVCVSLMGVWSKSKYSPNRKRKLTNRRDGIVTYLFIFFSFVPFIKKIDMCNKEYMLKGDALKWIDKDNIFFFYLFRLHTILIVWFNLDQKQKEIKKTKKKYILLTIKFWLLNQNIISGVNEFNFFNFFFL